MRPWLKSNPRHRPAPCGSRPDGNGRLICYIGDKFDNIYEFIKIFLKIFLRNGMVLVDIGRTLARVPSTRPRLIGSTGSVFAFEADPETYRLVLENIERNKVSNVQVRQTCVGEEVGAVSFFKNKDGAKSSIVDRGEKVAVTLPADKLDNLISAAAEIDTLKIDVEGAEIRVLEGQAGCFRLRDLCRS
jgi:FkbM family methyltransferase